MTISVDWPTGVISVQKSDLTLVQSTPTVIYDHDMSGFWRALRALEDSVDGRPFPSILEYDQSKTVGGVGLAAVLVLTDYYTVTYEDDQYAVNLKGLNTNVGDRINVNQVSIRSGNSAGLVQTNEIQFAAYQGGVTIDQSLTTTGSVYPLGTSFSPVGDLTAALEILTREGLDKVYIKNALTLDSGTWPVGTKFIGGSIFTSVITLTAGATVSGCEFNDAQLSGVGSGFARVNGCLISGNLSNISGFFDRCAFDEIVITLGAGQTNFVTCLSNVAGNGSPTIDCNGTGSTVAGRGYIGGIKFQNKTGTDAFSWDQTSGHLQALATCTAGEMVWRGVGRPTDLSTGTCYVNSTALISGTRTVKGQGYVSVASVAEGGQAGTDFPIGTDDAPVDNFADALVIALQNNVSHFKVTGNLTTVGTEDLSNYVIYSQSATNASLTITAGTTTTTAVLRDLKLTGQLSSDGIHIERCRIDNLMGVAGFVYSSAIITSIGFAGNANVWACEIDPDAISQQCVFNFGGTALTVIASGWGAGRVSAQNMITGSVFGMSGTGRVIPHTSNTGGTVVYAGGMLVDSTEAARLDELRDSTSAGAVVANPLTLTVGKFIGLK